MIHTVCARDVSGMAQGEATTFLEVVDAEREHVTMTTITWAESGCQSRIEKWLKLV